MLGQQIGVGQNTVSCWERGTSEPYPRHVAALAAALGVTVAYLLGQQEDRAAGASHDDAVFSPMPAAGAQVRPLPEPVSTPRPKTLPPVARVVGAGPGVIALPYYSGVACGPESELIVEDEPVLVVASQVPASGRGALAAVRVRGDSMAPTVAAGDVVIVRRLAAPVVLGERRDGRARIPVSAVAREAPHRSICLIEREHGMSLKRLVYDRRSPGEWHMALLSDNPAHDPVIITASDTVTIHAVGCGIIMEGGRI